MRRSEKRASASKFRVGQRVTFNSTVRPYYLQGLGATVIKVNRTRAKIKLDAPAGRFKGIINCPFNLIDARISRVSPQVSLARLSGLAGETPPS